MEYFANQIYRRIFEKDSEQQVSETEVSGEASMSFDLEASIKLFQQSKTRRIYVKQEVKREAAGN